RDRVPPGVERGPAHPPLVPGSRLEQHDDERAEGDRSAERHVERGTKDRHGRIDRRRQSRRGLRSEDSEVRDLACERGHFDLLEVPDRLPHRTFRLHEDRLAIEAAPTALKPSIDRLTEWLSVVIASDSWTRPASR